MQITHIELDKAHNGWVVRINHIDPGRLVDFQKDVGHVDHLSELDALIRDMEAALSPPADPANR